MLDRLAAQAAQIVALEAEVAAWKETAAQFSRGVAYYQGLVTEIGAQFGQAAYISDDGSRQEEILCAKVPALVAALKTDLAETKAEVARLTSECEFNVMACQNMDAEIAIYRTQLEKAEAEVEQLKEMNRIQRIALDFDPFVENRRLKADLAPFVALVEAAERYKESLASGLVCLAGQTCHDPLRDHRHWSQQECEALYRLMAAFAHPAVQRALKDGE